MMMRRIHPSKKTFSCRFLALPQAHCCAIVESVDEAVITFDLEKIVTYVNPAAEKITGLPVEEAIGRKCSDVIRSELCQGQCPVDAILNSGKPFTNLRTMIVTQSGAVKSVSLNACLLRSDDGKPAGVVETLRDLSELEQLRKQITREYTIEDIIGRSAKMRKLLSFLPDIAESDSAVLIGGATGTGKELIAKAIHRLSSRRTGPFVAVNCAALPESLLESELFGHTKGAFTGALKDRMGRFELADGGTLFLDEISSTSMAFQADLLRVLQDGQFVPVGGTEAKHTSFRLIAATNEDLLHLIHQDRFRADLYYRVGVAKIHLPALGERKEDIPILVDHFIHKFNLFKGRGIRGASPEALAALFDYPFPGNIRELENIIEYAFISCKGEWIELAHLPGELQDLRTDDRSTSPISFESDEALKMRAALERRRGNRISAAKDLGCSRTTLWRKIKKYGLDR